MTWSLKHVSDLFRDLFPDQIGCCCQRVVPVSNPTLNVDFGFSVLSRKMNVVVNADKETKGQAYRRSGRLKRCLSDVLITSKEGSILRRQRRSSPLYPKHFAHLCLDADLGCLIFKVDYWLSRHAQAQQFVCQ